MFCKTERHFALENFGSHHGHHNCCCTGTHFLSKKKKTQMLKDYAAELRERAKDIEDYLNEQKEKK